MLKTPNHDIKVPKVYIFCLFLVLQKLEIRPQSNKELNIHKIK